MVGGYGAAYGLPKKGQTDLERVESMLDDARAGFLIGPNAVEVNLIHRNAALTIDNTSTLKTQIGKSKRASNPPERHPSPRWIGDSNR